MTVQEITPAALASAKEAEQALIAAKSCQVTSSDDYLNAGHQLKLLSTRAKELEGMRVNLKSPALETCKRIDDFFRVPQEYLESAKLAIKTALGNYDDEIERRRKEAERIAAETARKEREKLEQEAAKLEAAARARREADEAKAQKLAEAGRQAEAAAKRKAADELEAARLRDVEARRLAAATMPTAPVVHIETPKVKGLSKRKNWTYEIIDESALPREHLSVNHKSISGVVKALKDKTNIPGVRAYAENTIASRGT